MWSTQDPLLRQGAETHSSMSTSHCLPETQFYKRRSEISLCPVLSLWERTLSGFFLKKILHNLLKEPKYRPAIYFTVTLPYTIVLFFLKEAQSSLNAIGATENMRNYYLLYYFHLTRTFPLLSYQKNMSTNRK